MLVERILLPYSTCVEWITDGGGGVLLLQPSFCAGSALQTKPQRGCLVSRCDTSCGWSSLVQSSFFCAMTHRTGSAVSQTLNSWEESYPATILFFFLFLFFVITMQKRPFDSCNLTKKGALWILHEYIIYLLLVYLDKTELYDLALALRVTGCHTLPDHFNVSYKHILIAVWSDP